MAEEEKGFVIKDRRSFDDKGDLKKESPSEEDKKEEKKEEKKDERKKGAAAGEPGRPPLPEASFTSLIFSLSSSALLHMGEVPDPQTGEKIKDLPIAKHTIDTIAMLKEKTGGNLTDEEKKFLDAVLTEVRLRFVNATR